MKGTRLPTIDTKCVDKVGAKVRQVKEKDMKRFKKLSALMLAAVMVLAMALPAFAAPSSADKGTIKVTGVEAGATVKAVRIVEPVYGANGLNGYKFADKYAAAAEELGLKVDNLEEKLTPDAVSKLFATIAKGDFTIDLTGDKAGYTAEVPAGLYMVYIVGTTDEDAMTHNIYNPLVVALAYDPEKAGTDTTLVSGEYDFGVANTAEAKHTTTDAGKKIVANSDDAVKDAHADTVKVGDTITWELYADVPTWNSDAYKKLTFRMTDTMEAGTFENVRDYVVKDAAGNVIDPSNYTLTPATDDNLTFVIDMNDAWLRDSANQGQRITVTYKATLAEGASQGFDPNTNDFKLQYSHDPSYNPDEDPTGENEPLEEIEEKTNDYTVEIAFFKYDEATGAALAGAGFTLYSDAECTQVVRPEVMSDANGSFGFKGLDEGTYYMKETTTPAGYAATDEVYTVVIDTVVNDTETVDVQTYTNDEGLEVTKTIKEHTAELVSYTTTVTNKAGDEVGKLEVTKDDLAEGATSIDLTKDFAARICNTKIPQLPSTGGMGTYLFTIAGVALIAVAAFMLISKRRNVTE